MKQRKYIISLYILFLSLVFNAGLRAADLVVNVTYLPSQPCSNSAINFKSTIVSSNGGKIAYTWQFGDYTKIDTTANPSHIYTSNSSWPAYKDITVQLTVTELVPPASTRSAIWTQKIRVYKLPDMVLDDVQNTTNFSNCMANPTPTSSNFTIKVTNETNMAEVKDGTMSIDWGDGSPILSNLKNADFGTGIPHIYTKLGYFKLIFTGEGLNGCVSAKEYEVKNEGNPSIGISSDGSTIGCAPQTYSYRLLNYDKNSSSTTYKISINDGTPSVTWNNDSITLHQGIIEHTFIRSSCEPSNWEKKFSITVETSNSCAKTNTAIDAANIFLGPQAAFTAPALFCEGQPVSFTNTTNTGYGFGCSKENDYWWNFGDGSPVYKGSTPPPHLFPGVGPYIVQLSARNGCDSTSFSKEIKLLKKLALKVTALDSAICLGETVGFKNLSEGDSQTHLWSVSPTAGVVFSGGTSASSAEPKIQFNTKGKYTVTYKLTNPCASFTKTFTITVAGVGSATIKPQSAYCPGAVFDAAKNGNFSLNLNSGFAIYQQWHVWPMNGVTYVGGTTLTSVYPQIKFSEPGRFALVFKALNQCADTIIVSTEIVVTKPAKAAIDISTLNDCAPAMPVITNHSTGDFLTHRWKITPDTGFTFVLPASADSANPQIRFNSAGVYNVKYTVSNSCSTSDTNFVFTAYGKPIVTFAPIADACGKLVYDPATERNVTFNDNGNPITAYKWRISPSTGVSFISGNENSKFPVINFENDGAYTLTLEATNKCGTTTKQGFINITNRPLFLVEPTDTLGCVPFRLNFRNSSTGTYINYKWTFTPDTGFVYLNGTGNKSAEPNIQFNSTGSYQAVLKAKNACDSATINYNIVVHAAPTVTFQALPDACTGYRFNATNFGVKYAQNGSAISAYKWTITPASGVTFRNNTKATSALPVITFDSVGVYRVEVSATNGCGVTTVSHDLKIEPHVDARAGADLTYCLTTGLLPLTATPAGGTWRLANGTTGAAITNLPTGNYFSATRASTFTLYYEVGAGSCYSIDTLKIRTYNLPASNAGADINICSNDTFRITLNGLPKGGVWSGTNITGNRFDPRGLSPGSYQIFYTVTNAATGCVRTDTAVITIAPSPDATFAAPAQGCVGEVIRFDPNGGLQSYSWNFGDGTAGNSGSTIYHTYTAAGTYTIKLVSAVAGGCKDSSSRKITITALPPNADFTLSRKSGCGPLTTRFTVVAANYNGKGLTYFWDYGDGTTSTKLNNPSTKIYTAGQRDTFYIIKFTVSNSCGSSTHTDTVVVGTTAHAEFTMPHEWECSPVTVKFRNLTSGIPISYKWDFGDGKTGTAFEPTHTYTATGSTKIFTVTLISRNTCGYDTARHDLKVFPNSISAYITTSKRNVCTGERVDFQNFSTDTAASFRTMYWDFGDGVQSTQWNAWHIWDTPGVYPVKLILDNGCSRRTIADTVTVYAQPMLSIAGTRNICLGDTLNLTLNSSVALKSVMWHFGDGDSATTGRHIYRNAGVFNLSVTTVSAEGITNCTSQVISTVNVYPKPEVSILPADTASCSPLVYAPVLRTSSPGLWNYGDGSAPTSRAEHHFVNNSGVLKQYQISFEAENTYGCKNTGLAHLAVYPTPVAAISLIDYGGYPNEVLLKNTSVNSTQCSWILPDGSLVNSCDSQRVYFSVNGESLIKLVAQNQYGCRDTAIKMHNVAFKGLYFPNAFMPGNENNKVNTFKGVGIGLKEYELTIYDKWGNRIWTTKQIENTMPADGWNGNGSDGNPLPPGVYLWRAHALFIDDSVWKGMKGDDGKYRTNGSITLIR